MTSTHRSPWKGDLLLGLLLPSLLLGCAEKEARQRVAQVVLDLTHCFDVPASGSDYLCVAALEHRFAMPELGACLAVEVSGAKGAVERTLPMSVRIAEDGSWLLSPSSGPLQLEVAEGDVARLRLFLLTPAADPAQLCPEFGVESDCRGDGCLFAFAPSTTPVAGDGELVIRYGVEGNACGIQCNDPCDPASQSCQRICYTPEHPPTELCDGRDNDCDGETDEGFFLGAPCAGKGECDDGRIECDDTDPFHRLTRCSTAPGGSQYDPEAVERQEICDGLDNDCDGTTDEDAIDVGPANPCGETRGECRPGYYACDQGSRVCVNIEVGPLPELCDGLDNDCDGDTDEDFDFEGDPLGTPCQGTGECGGGEIRCHRTDQHRACCSADPDCGWVGPGVAEICDGLDNDCDGRVDEDFTVTDAVGVVRAVGEPCRGRGVCDAGGRVECAGESDAVCSTMPGGSDHRDSPELCDGLDNDCDGDVDEDFFYSQQAVGETPAGDLPIGAICELPGICGKGLVECDAADLEGRSTLCSSGPGGSLDRVQPETCNAADDDCDGDTDEDDPGGGGECGSDEGACLQGVWHCRGGQLVCEGGVEPRAELCNGVDDDCDGDVDEDNPEGGAACGSPIGACRQGVLRCITGELICDGEQQGVDERCNGIDDDCDGEVDEDFTYAQPEIAGSMSAGLLRIGALCEVPGRCGFGLVECAAGDPTQSTVVCSSGPGGSRSRVAQEVCNGEDDDCDGTVDDGFNVGAACGPTGECAAGVLECAGPAATRCSTGPGGSQSLAELETCDGRDNDCDGTVDDGYDVGTPCNPPGECGQGVMECRADHQSTICSTGPGGSQSQVQAEDCNGLDDDCDGVVDNGVLNPCGNCGVNEVCDTVCGSGRLVCADIGGGGPEDACEPGLALTGRVELLGCAEQFTREAIASVVVDSAGTVELLGADQMRFEYDPVVQERVLLQEGAGQNLVLWSADMTQPVWTGTANVTVELAEEGSPVDPAGGRANKLTMPNLGALYQFVTVPVDVPSFTLSFWARAGTTSSIRVEAPNNVPQTGTLQLGPQWVRYTTTFARPADVTDSLRILFRNMGAQGSFYIWGLQLEGAQFASSYMPSAGATGSRDAEIYEARPGGARARAGTWLAWVRPLFEFTEITPGARWLELEGAVTVDYLHAAQDAAGRLRCTAGSRSAELILDAGSWQRGDWLFVGCSWDDADAANPGVRVYFWRSGVMKTAEAMGALGIPVDASPAYVRPIPTFAASRDVRVYRHRLSTAEVEAVRSATQDDYRP